MKLFLVTGATGFVGSECIKALKLKTGFSVLRGVRKKSLASDVSDFVCDLNKSNHYDLVGVKTIIHTAAITSDIYQETQAEVKLNQINNIGTLNLAKQAAAAGVERFVFLSSIKVNGEQTNSGRFFIENMEPHPGDAYGRSKYKAEKALLDLAEKTNMEVVIIRPPLVYGTGVKANFTALINLVKKSLPLPLGIVRNKRSMIAIDNLVDFICLCADRERSPLAANQVFVISDDEDVSTTQLLRKIAKAYDKRQWLIPISVSWMKFVAKLLGKSEQADKLFGNLQIDCSKAKNLLGWKPVITMDEQLKKMADAEK